MCLKLSKQICLSLLLRDTERLDEPEFLSCSRIKLNLKKNVLCTTVEDCTNGEFFAKIEEFKKCVNKALAKYGSGGGGGGGKGGPVIN